MLRFYRRVPILPRLRELEQERRREPDDRPPRRLVYDRAVRASRKGRPAGNRPLREAL